MTTSPEPLAEIMFRKGEIIYRDGNGYFVATKDILWGEVFQVSFFEAIDGAPEQLVNMPIDPYIVEECDRRLDLRREARILRDLTLARQPAPLDETDKPVVRWRHEPDRNRNMKAQELSYHQVYTKSLNMPLWGVRLGAGTRLANLPRDIRIAAERHEGALEPLRFRSGTFYAVDWRWPEEGPLDWPDAHEAVVLPGDWFVEDDRGIVAHVEKANVVFVLPEDG